MDIPLEIVVPVIAALGAVGTALKVFLGSDPGNTNDQNQETDATPTQPRRPAGQREWDQVDTGRNDRRDRARVIAGREEQPKPLDADQRELEELIEIIEHNHYRGASTVRPDQLDYDWPRARKLVDVSDFLSEDGRSVTIEGGAKVVFEVYSRLRSTWLQRTIPEYRAQLEKRIATLKEGWEDIKQERKQASQALKDARLGSSQLEQQGFDDESDDANRYMKFKSDERTARQTLKRLAADVDTRQVEIGEHQATLRELSRHTEDANFEELAEQALRHEFLQLAQIDGLYSIGVSSDGYIEARIRKTYEYDGVQYDFGDWAIRVGNPTWPYPKFKLLNNPMKSGFDHPYFHYYEGSDFCIGSSNEQVRDHMVKGNLVGVLSLISTTLGHANYPSQVPVQFKRFKQPKKEVAA